MSFYTVDYVSLSELSIEITIDLSSFSTHNKTYHLKFKYTLYLLQTNRNDNLTLKIKHRKLIDDHGLISSIK